MKKPEKTQQPPKNDAKVYALRLLTVRDRSKQELRERLEQRFSAEEAAEALQYTEDLGYVDDQRFAMNYVQYRNRTRPSGNYLLRFELRSKGVGDHYIDQALNPPDMEYELALAVAKQRMASLERLEPIVRLRRLYGLLERRGFPSGLTRRVVGELLDRDLENEYN
ncbi:MAG TPA: regulatory protein RecX [Firmicutes bacterium]|nr:regulatory protein RecX [Bacillota bacterium]